MSKVYETEVVEILENGDALIELPPDLLNDLGWREGDSLVFSHQKDGAIIIERADEAREKYVANLPHTD